MNILALKIIPRIRILFKVVIKKMKNMINKRNKTIKYDYGRTYEWLIIAQSYFQCALINVRIMKSKTSEYCHIEGSPIDICLKEFYGEYKQNPGYLVFPIIYNFKHGIELYLKAIMGFKNSEFLKKHNIIKLSQNANIKDEKLRAIINKYGYSKLFLPNNQKQDQDNIFERYPQGSPYDDLKMYGTNEIFNDDVKVLETINKLDSDEQQTIQHSQYKAMNFAESSKVEELINDISYVYDVLRQESINMLKASKGQNKK